MDCLPARCRSAVHGEILYRRPVPALPAPRHPVGRQIGVNTLLLRVGRGMYAGLSEGCLQKTVHFTTRENEQYFTFLTFWNQNFTFKF